MYEILEGEHVAEGFTCPPVDPYRALKRESAFWKQDPRCDAMRAMARTILTRAHTYQWTVQGFGFLRTYLGWGDNPKRFRLNVWDPSLSVPNVSVIHDHPWSFDSYVLSGAFRNVRYTEDHFSGDEYTYMTIKTGEGGQPIRSTESSIRLRPLATEHYAPGDIYHQDADEIHHSEFDAGTVTLNDRTGDTEHARVFWPAGGPWVDAKPHVASGEIVERITDFALSKWKD